MQKIDSDFNIMVVDDDLEYAETCVRAIQRAGFHAIPVDSPTEALDIIQRDGQTSLILTDLQMPQMDGVSFLKAVKRFNPTIEVVIMTGYGTIESAVSSIKSGALEYITKPFDNNELLNAIQRVYKVWHLEKQVQQLQSLVTDELQLSGYVFRNTLMNTVYKRIASASHCDCSVFISGESGTGKELVANAIHINSDRSRHPFIPVNCSALAGSLIESELFGYRKGAFTGANKNYDGLFVAADGGTLFLDEIGEMEIQTQSKLLRSIQNRKIRPVGSVEERPVNIRFIAAINQNVQQAIADKKLREDLYHRLSVITIDVPPLRRMKDDIPKLLDYLLVRKGEEHGKTGYTCDSRAIEALMAYHWPGNIREVANVIERCLINCESSTIRLKDLPKNIVHGTSHSSNIQELPTFDEAERDLVIKALKSAHGNKSRAAAILGISRPRLYKKIEQFNIKDSSL